MAAGLFTLDASKLDEGVLGGPGTGFVAGETVSAGSVSGLQGFAGSVSGVTVSTGTADGNANRFGVVAGTQTSVGAVSGVAGASGLVTGITQTAGSVTGAFNGIGVVSNVTPSAGSVTGSPGLTGSGTGSTASNGTVTGTPDTPPVPPPPPPPIPEPITGAGPRLFYPQPRPQPIQPTHARGTVRGETITTHRARGRCGYNGTVTNATVTGGNCSGVVWPDARELKRRRQRSEENELISLGML